MSLVSTTDLEESGGPGFGANILRDLGLGRPELRAWAMYDWANSAMVTTIITAVFPIYFSDVAGANLPRAVATRHFAAVSTIAMVLIAVISPFLGALADTRPIKKRLLSIFMILGVAGVAAMYFIERGDWVMAAFLFMLANIGANGSFVFYDALLPHIAEEHEIDRVSTAGYALGYVGGGLLLVANLAWILRPEWFGLPSGPNATASQLTLPTRLAFLSVAVWWLVFAIPLFRSVAEPAINTADELEPGQNPMVLAFKRLGETLRALRSYKQGFLMLLAFVIYNDGIGTIIRMATIYGREIGIGTGAMIGSLVVVQFVGIPFAFLFGHLATKIGAKQSILIALGVYVGISVLGRFMTNAYHFFMLSVLVGMVQGGSQALSRSLFASLIPRERSGEFFGFFSVAEKFAGIFGPLLFAATLWLAGSSRSAILTVIGFFVLGGILLAFVDVEEGKREAQRSEGELLANEDPVIASGPPEFAT